MFSYLELKNFKSFKDIFIDFRGKYQKPKNMIFLYGENGSGKSNLVYAFSFLKETMQTLNIQNHINELINKDVDMKEILTNSTSKIWANSILRSLDNLKNGAFIMQAEGDMVIKYGFNVSDCEGYYELVFGKTLKSETLYYKVDKNRGFLFKIDRENMKLNSKIFVDTEYKETLEKLIEIYWGKHTFLSILFNEFNQKNEEYLLNGLDQNLIYVMEFLSIFSVRCKLGTSGESGFMGTEHFLSSTIDSGRISVDSEANLNKQEEAIRELLTSLYSDIKDVYYKKEIDKENKEIKYKLFLRKLIGGEIKDIDFKLESTGTQNIIGLFPALFESVIGNVSIIDEADAGIHDILFNKIIEDISDNIKGQLIITTHNTTLLENLDPENIYFILVDYMGNKLVVNVNDYEERTQSTHNIRERYLKGTYQGIPNVATVDFENITDIMTK